MSDTAAQPKDDQIRKPIKEKPFPQGNGNGADKPHDPRAEALEKMSNSYDDQRLSELQEAESSDPEIAMKRRAIELAAGARELDPGEKVRQEQGDVSSEGLATREVITNEGSSEAVRDTQLIDSQLPEVISKYIEIREGKPMMKFNVDGNIEYRDLDYVNANGQKYEAGDRRMRQASEWSEQLRNKELELNTRMFNAQQQSITQGNSTSTQDASDFDVQAASGELVDAMFSGTREQAEEKMAEVFSKLRTTARPTQNVDELIDKAKEAAKTEFAQEQYNREVMSAWNNFTTDFRDVHDDDDAFAFADAITGKIASEHPDWNVSQVMYESGKRARDIILNGSKKVQHPPPSDEQRHANKETLTPMPHAQSTVVQKPQQDRPETAREILADIRAARHQSA